MAKFCPECGFEQHNNNNRYCSNCGFDFSKLEGNIKSEESDNSSITVPITSDVEIISKPAESTDSKTISSNSSVSPIDSSAKSPSSNARTTKTNSSKSNNGFLSNLTFNKCFLAFAVIMAIFLIIGMIAQTDTNPYSDDGLTSFMESSSSYGLSDFIEDSKNYDENSDLDYLSYVVAIVPLT